MSVNGSESASKIALRERHDDQHREDARYAVRALRNLEAFALNTAGPRSGKLDDGDYEGHYHDIRDGASIVLGGLVELSTSLGEPHVTQLVNRARSLMSSQVQLVKQATRRMQTARAEPKRADNSGLGGADPETVDPTTSLWVQASDQSDQLMKIHNELLAIVRPVPATQDGP